MKFLVAIPLFIFLITETVAQVPCSLTISGIVLDQEKKPLPGATVFIKDHNRGEVTTADGTFVLSHLCEGEYQLEVKFVGFQTKELTILLSKNEKIEVELSFEEKLLSEVVISDHREVVSKTASYGSVTGKELEELRGKSLGESLQNITGLNTIQSGPAIFKPVIHGLHSQRILILNNGVRQEGQQWGAEHAPEIDPFIASNLVVVKDAGALKYGTDALGGVVIVTPAELPTDQKIGGQLHLIGSTNGRSGTISGILEGGIKKLKGWGWRVQGTSKNSGDLHTPDYNLSNTGYKELNYSTSIGYHKENKGFEFFFSHFNTTIGVLRGSAVSSTLDLSNAISSEPPQNTSQFTYSIKQPRQEVKHNLLKATTHIRKGDNLFHAQYALQFNDREEFDVRRGNLNNVPVLGYLLYTHTLDFDWEKTKSKNHSRSFGINGMLQDNNKKDGTQTLPFIPDFTNYSTGVYWIEKLSGNKWNWEAGARYDFRFYNVAGFDFNNTLYRSKLNFNNISATTAGTFKLSEKSSISTSLGYAWRPPNVAELYSIGTHQSAAAIEFGLMLDEVSNEVRPPEELSLKVENALKWVNTYRAQVRNFDWEVTGYMNYIINYIFLKPGGVTQNSRGIFPYFRYTQTDALFLGADFSVGYNLSKKIRVNSKVSLLKAKDAALKDPLIFIAPNKFDLSLRYEQPKLGGWLTPYIEMHVKYVAKQRYAPRVVSIPEIISAEEQGIDLFETDKRIFDFVDAPPGYLVSSLNAGLSRNINSSKLEFRISINNLTNTSYREYTNRMRYYADEIGRNFSIAIKYIF